MSSLSKRRWVWVRVCVYAVAGLVVGRLALAQGPTQGARPLIPVPGPVVPLREAEIRGFRAPSNTLRILTEPRSYDACLVRVPELDPGFSVAARPMDEVMVAPAPVVGLYRGTLAPRR